MIDVTKVISGAKIIENGNLELSQTGKRGNRSIETTTAMGEHVDVLWKSVQYMLISSVRTPGSDCEQKWKQRRSMMEMRMRMNLM